MSELHQTEKGTNPKTEEQDEDLTQVTPAESFAQFILEADYPGRKQKAIKYASLPDRMHRIPDDW